MKYTTACIGALALACAPAAQAHIGVATGIGPHLSNPLTPHIGRVYWKPGHNRAVQAGSDAGTELEQFLHPRAIRHKLAKAKCDRQRIEYFERHGITTPTPLKGFHGCKKYALDAGYWQQRHYGVPKDNLIVWRSAYNMTTTVQIAIHNVVLPW